MIIKPLIRSNMCINAHPKGCAADVKHQIEFIEKKFTTATKPQLSAFLSKRKAPTVESGNPAKRQVRRVGTTTWLLTSSQKKRA